MSNTEPFQVIDDSDDYESEADAEVVTPDTDMYPTGSLKSFNFNKIISWFAHTTKLQARQSG